MPERTFKVVIQKRTLSGSRDDDLLQRVATIYLEGGKELRVYAPSRATGDVLEWVDHCSVCRPDEDGFNPNTEIELEGASRIFARKVVKEELERIQRDANRPEGMNPDGLYYDAHICLHGHVQSSGRRVLNPGKHCAKCGSPNISDCPACKIPIRGEHRYSEGHYRLPQFCHNCGSPFPWMKERLDTAHDLLYHDDKLSLEERNKLWATLRYVMSDPKSDLVPEKKKLIEINLQKAAAATREAVTDLLAKYLAEISKG